MLNKRFSSDNNHRFRTVSVRGLKRGPVHPLGWLQEALLMFYNSILILIPKILEVITTLSPQNQTKTNFLHSEFTTADAVYLVLCNIRNPPPPAQQVCPQLHHYPWPVDTICQSLDYSCLPIAFLCSQCSHQFTKTYGISRFQSISALVTKSFT